MGHSIDVAHDPSVADYRATSPRWCAGRVPFGRPRDPAVMRSKPFHRLVADLTAALEA